ncbi:VCBS repeat-containing protein [candidate division KSB1 bacterium]|nr:VCBS repeat-containing protein [candidate division KSB1 bacterium]
MNRTNRLILILGGILLQSFSAQADFPIYTGSPPYSFEIDELPYGDEYWVENKRSDWSDQFLVADLNGDGLLDFCFRSKTKLYAYSHAGTKMWPEISIENPGGNTGAKHGAADVDGDGQVEIVAIDRSNKVYIFNGATGAQEGPPYTISGLWPDQRIGHIAIANLRGTGDRDAILQTIDANMEKTSTSNAYYINRTLIAINLEDGSEIIWSSRVTQDNNTSPTIYEGYWGQAHGPFFAADIDYDGLDEIVGGNLIESDGSIISLSYPDSWVSGSTTYIDHLDAIAVGDFRADKPGLEWIVTEEDWEGNSDWHTTLISYNPSAPGTSILWRNETTLPNPDPIKFFGESYKEPQNICAGNFFSQTPDFSEVWVRSRLGDSDYSQHPWLFNAYGTQITHYSIDAVLPGSSTSDYFNQYPSGYNKQGLEVVWTIDWDGSDKEYIAAKARHLAGNVGVFDALNGSSVWHTGTDGDADYGPVQSVMIYAADIAGDSREEVIVIDQTNSPPEVQIYWNTTANTNKPKMSKWEDPLYTRLKQNWNYYSPGSYTQPAPAKLNMQVFLEGPYDADANAMTTELKDQGFIPLQSPYSEDPSTAEAIPDDAVDWVLLELRETLSGDSVFSRSLILQSDGQIVDLDGTSPVPLHVVRGQYYLVLKHRNHLGVITTDLERLSPDSTTTVDLRSDAAKVHNSVINLLEAGVYGLYAADGNKDGIVKNDDKNDIWRPDVGLSGYFNADFNLDYIVKNDDKNDYWRQNVGMQSAIP